MTMTTYTHLVCECGHRGTLKLRENDQPYSKEWSQETYIDGDHRQQYSGTNSTFHAAEQTCPACGR